jgi:YVTN family beta-propeller protein
LTPPAKRSNQQWSQAPEWVAFNEDSAFAYVTNITSDNVTVIDTASATVTNTIAVGSAPIGIGVMGTVKVSTVAGDTYAPSALNAAIGGPFSSVYDSAGNLYTSDLFMNRIRKVTPAGAISTYSGTGICACRERHLSGRHLKSYPGVAIQTAPT